MKLRGLVGLAIVPLALARCGGCEGTGGGTGLPGDVALSTPASGSYHGCGFSIETGVSAAPYARIREDSGSCLRFTATVAGSAPPSGAQSWANPLAGSWSEVSAGGATLGGASFTIQADDGCIVHLQYNGSGTRSLASDNCA